jgi:hypothetical protein
MGTWRLTQKTRNALLDAFDETFGHGEGSATLAEKEKPLQNGGYADERT